MIKLFTHTRLQPPQVPHKMQDYDFVEVLHKGHAVGKDAETNRCYEFSSHPYFISMQTSLGFDIQTQCSHCPMFFPKKI